MSRSIEDLQFDGTDTEFDQLMDALINNGEELSMETTQNAVVITAVTPQAGRIRVHKFLNTDRTKVEPA